MDLYFKRVISQGLRGQYRQAFCVFISQNLSDIIFRTAILELVASVCVGFETVGVYTHVSLCMRALQ